MKIRPNRPRVAQRFGLQPTAPGKRPFAVGRPHSASSLTDQLSRKVPDVDQDKVVVVTGGGSGIGRATALTCAKEGARVLITGRRAEPLSDTASQNANIYCIVADVAEPADANRTIAAALDRWRRLDVLVNNAGAGAIFRLSDATAERIAAIYSVNVIGPSLLAAAALRHLEATNGSIINISTRLDIRRRTGFPTMPQARLQPITADL
ncbi:MAG: SDR family oxidoreductase [Hyphomicrobiaceae bacterium]